MSSGMRGQVFNNISNVLYYHMKCVQKLKFACSYIVGTD